MQAGWSRELGIVVEGLIPEHQLRMVSVVVGDDVITLHYRISPALPARDPGTGRPPWLTWDWHGVDDLGNDYEPWGGAYGTSEDGLTTLGDLTLQPAPPPAARHLYVHLAPFRHDEGDLGSAQVGIPLRPRGPAEDARR